MKLNKNQIKWTLIAIALFIISIVFTPITLFFEHGIIISMIEALICAAFVAFSVLNISSLYELLYLNEKEESKSFMSVLLPFGSFIVLGFLIFGIIDTKIDTKIERQGKFTNATVQNGEQIITQSLRRGTSNSYNITLTYKDSITNEEFNIKTDIDAEIFKSVYKGQTIQIKYLPQYPTIFKIMVGNENVQKFKKISNRGINLNDLKTLIDKKDVNIQTDYLNSISQGWVNSTDERGTIFSNEIKGELIAFLNNGVIYFKAPNLDYFIPKDQIIRSNQLPEEKEEGVLKQVKTLYETDSLLITKVFKMVNSSSMQIENYLLIEIKQ